MPSIGQKAKAALCQLQDALEELDKMNVGSARRKALEASWKLREVIAELEKQL